ncbi:MAG TPA: NUDIX domain-containing protein [Sphingobacterium sp.]|nr:NUDIX domain-containing protein [Sphingobacterium sp.]
MLSHFTIDCVILTFDKGELKVLLTERNRYPYKDWWALPGFFVGQYEEMEEAVHRILYELTGLDNIYMEQLAAFGGVKRHPEGRVLTVAYYTLVKYEDVKEKVKPVTDYMKSAKWFNVSDLPELAFDHKEILDKNKKELKIKMSYAPIVFELLPDKFTLTQLQQICEVLLEKKLDKRNFRKKIQSQKYIKALDEYQTGVSYRAARLYQFDEDEYPKLA